MKPRRVTVPEFELYNPRMVYSSKLNIISKWVKAFYSIPLITDHYKIFELKLARYTQEDNIAKVKQLILLTSTQSSEEIDILREVINSNYPQYKDLADKIIMLQ